MSAEHNYYGHLVSGEFQLSPVMKRYFAQKLLTYNKHFNANYLIATSFKFELELLQQALDVVIKHYDSLRLRFFKADDGSWCAKYANGAESLTMPLHQVDLNDLSECEQISTVQKVYDKNQELNITDGPLIKVVLFRGMKISDSIPTDYILFTINHLVYDGHSFVLIWDDLQKIYMNLVRGEEVDLPAKTTSYIDWVSSLERLCVTNTIQEQWDFWLNSMKATSFPVQKNVASVLRRDMRRFLFDIADVSELPEAAYKNGKVNHDIVNNLLLASLLKLSNKLSGQQNLLLHTIYNGRKYSLRTRMPGIDLSRSVGWFVTIIPTRLDLPKHTDGANDKADLRNIVKSVSKQLHKIPDRGVGFSLLRYISDDSRAEILAKHDAKVNLLFNYHGSIASENFRQGDLIDMYYLDEENQAEYLIDISSYIVNHKLEANFYYSTLNYTEESIEQMVFLYKEIFAMFLACLRV